jgi:hypothetical protein
LKNELTDVNKSLKLTEGTGTAAEERDKELQKWLKGNITVSQRISNLTDSKRFRELLNTDLRDDKLLDKAPVIKTIIPKIKTELGNELQKKIEGSGNEDLLNTWNSANQKYAKFKQTFDVDDRTRKASALSGLVGSKNPDISKFFNSLVKPNVKNDETSGIKELFSYLPDQVDRNKVAFDVVKAGEDNPDEFMKNYGKLGKNQKDLLFPQHKAELDELQQTFKRFPSAFKPPRELGRMGKLFETLRVGGALAAAPVTKGLSLGVVGAPGIGRAVQGEALDRALLQNILERTRTGIGEGPIARAFQAGRRIRPGLTAATLQTLLGGQQ